MGQRCGQLGVNLIQKRTWTQWPLQSCLRCRQQLYCNIYSVLDTPRSLCLTSDLPGAALLHTPALLTWSRLPRLSITCLATSPVWCCSKEAFLCSRSHRGSHLGNSGFSPGLWYYHCLCTCAHHNRFLSISSAPTWVPCSAGTEPERDGMIIPLTTVDWKWQGTGEQVWGQGITLAPKHLEHLSVNSKPHTHLSTKLANADYTDDQAPEESVCE